MHQLSCWVIINNFFKKLHSSGQRTRRVLRFDFLSSTLPYRQNCFLSESSPWSKPSLDCSSVGVLLSDALFTGSPSDNCSDEEDSTAMSGLHESLVWTSGNSWLNQAPSCFSSWTLFTPVEVLTVNAIFLHSDMHFLNLFLSWSTLNGKLPSSYLWPKSLSTLAYISAFFEFFVFVKINFFL